ncbi:hypothetical protein Pve01_94980 [Planomonospora venezuelensis]|nr:hypothetical protein Pve01_94980 [Planomonospora venezuelensis]
MQANPPGTTRRTSRGLVAASELGGTVSDMEFHTALDGNPTWHLRSIDDVDELYSALSFSDPKLIVTPDGSVWEVWVDTEDETMQLHRLRGQSGCRQIEADSLQHAFSFLQDGAVVHTIENTD